MQLEFYKAHAYVSVQQVGRKAHAYVSLHAYVSVYKAHAYVSVALRLCVLGVCIKGVCIKKGSHNACDSACSLKVCLAFTRPENHYYVCAYTHTRTHTHTPWSWRAASHMKEREYVECNLLPSDRAIAASCASCANWCAALGASTLCFALPATLPLVALVPTPPWLACALS